MQATLQELTDLQDQLSVLQLENERMTEDKAVLLESLCSQTEKLEECRTQITQLKQLLFQQHHEDGQPLSASERESNLVDLLKVFMHFMYSYIKQLLRNSHVFFLLYLYISVD